MHIETYQISHPEFVIEDNFIEEKLNKKNSSP